MSLHMTGHCERFHPVPTYHNTSWCPDYHAVANVDWNAARKVDDGWEFFSIHYSRPVVVGETIICNSEDDLLHFGVVHAVDVGRDGIGILIRVDA